MEKGHGSEVDGVWLECSIDRQGVRRDYLSSGYSIEELSEKYGCYQNTTKKCAGRDGWQRCLAVNISESPPHGADLPADKPEDVLGEHRVLWNSVKKRLVMGLMSSDLKPSLEELKVAKVAAEVLTRVIEGERQAWGLGEDGSKKAPYEELKDTEELTRAMASLTVPSGTDETLD
jgi:hypothetical protein